MQTVFFFISQKADKPYIFKDISKVSITQKWFNYHLKADIETFPSSGVALLYDNY